MPKISVETELVTITCCDGDCGILFAVPEWWEKSKRRDHKNFYCPNGHPQAFLGKTQEELLKEKLRKTEETVTYYRNRNTTLEERNTTLKRGVAAQKGVATRLRNKAIAGICAFCAHEFPNVAAHVASEHPNEQLEEDPPVEGDS